MLGNHSYVGLPYVCWVYCYDVGQCCSFDEVDSKFEYLKNNFPQNSADFKKKSRDSCTFSFYCISSGGFKFFSLKFPHVKVL